MKILISGGTGFIGKSLTEYLINRGDQVTIISRKSPAKAPLEVRYIIADPNREGAWQEEIAAHDSVINLAGASIFRRWNRSGKKLILESRIDSTRNLVRAINLHGKKDMVLVNGSAVGYYGNTETAPATEDTSQGEDFLAKVASAWEAEAKKAACRVVCCRFGVVLGHGGALARMLPVFRAGLGSPFGWGKQPFAWIHIKDLMNIIALALDEKKITGPINCVAPVAVDNRAFSRALLAALGLPAVLPPLPAFIARLFAGEMADLVLKGRKVIPKKLNQFGYKFAYPDIEAALADLLARKRPH